MKRSRVRLIVFLCVCAAGGSDMAAQQPFWQRVDVFEWFERFEWSIAFGERGDIYSTDGRSGVFRSVDDGLRWTAANDGLGNRRVHDLHSTRPGNVFAATDDGVYRSDDKAEHWTFSSAGLPEGRVYSLANGGDDTLFALPGSGVFRSTDDGARWTAMGPASSSRCTGICVTRTGVLIVTTDDTLYRSTDAGASWSVCLARPRETFLAPIRDSAGVVYTAAGFGKVFSSADDGVTWQTIITGMRHIEPLATGPDGALYGVMFFGDGLMRSIDGAVSWTKIPWTTSSRKNYASCLLWDAQQRLLLGDDEYGVFRCARDFSSYEQLRGEPLNPAWTLDFASCLAISGDGSIAILPEHDPLLRSNDGGITWTRVAHTFGSSFGNRVFRGGLAGSMYVVSRDSLYVSNDGAAIWRVVPSPQGWLTTVLQLRSSTLLLGSTEGVYRSSDGGSNWHDVSAPTGVHSVIDIAQDDQGDVYVLVDSWKLLVSSDDGNTWQYREPAGGGGSYSQIACGGAGRLYALEPGGPMVAYSDDGGATYRISNSGAALFRPAIINTDAVGRVFVAGPYGWDEGIRISNTFGATWYTQNTGFYSEEYQNAFIPHVYDFARGPDGRMNALTDSGLFRGSDWPLDVESDVTQPSHFGYVYPNPFYDRTTITWTLDRSGQMDVSVFDLLGRSVATLAAGVFPAGTHTVPFSGIGLTPGVYFVRLGTATGQVLLTVIKR